MPAKTDAEIKALLNKIYDSAAPLLANISPDGWGVAYVGKCGIGV